MDRQPEPAQFTSVDAALAQLHQLPQPRTPEEVQEQLNILQRAVQLIDPSTTYEREILRALQQLIEVQSGGLEIDVPAGDDEDGAGGTTVTRLLNEIVLLLDDQVRGFTDVTDLPAGLAGQPTGTIPNGQEGVVEFDVAGGTFAAEIEASGQLDPQDIARVLPEGRNLVESVGVRRTEEFLTPPVLDPADQLAAANQRYDRGDRVDVDGTLEPGERKVIAEVSVERGHSFMLEGLNATAHPDVEYRYFIDQWNVGDGDLDPNDADPNLSGTSPWATPPDLYSPYGEGPVEVSSIKLQLANQSDDREFDTVQGSFTGFRVEVPE